MAIAIKTCATEESLIGRSHWWGAPDLPEGVPFPYVMVSDGCEEYPEPLTFVCQIRLEDIAMFDGNNLLPHTGLLYFFAPIDYFLGEQDSPLDYHTPPVVLYASGEGNLHPYDIHWDDSGESIFRPAEAMMFEKMAAETGDGHILLGKPYQEEVREENLGCVTLLQIDEDDRWGLRFFDCGMYYFLMPEGSLLDRDWDNASGYLFYY